MYLRSMWMLLAILLSFAAVPAAHAEQYVVRTAAGPKVVHTRVAPVLVHRILPPFRGQHVYHGRFR